MKGAKVEQISVQSRKFKFSCLLNLPLSLIIEQNCKTELFDELNVSQRALRANFLS